MDGIIGYWGRFGSTKQYATWLGESTGFPVSDLRKNAVDFSGYTTIILGSSVMVEKLTIAPWLNRQWPQLKDKQVLLFSVSGTAPDHPDIEHYFRQSIPEDIRQHITYIPLRGRLLRRELPWWTRVLLNLGAHLQKDEETKNRMLRGFDFMDRKQITPILGWIDHQMVPTQEEEMFI